MNKVDLFKILICLMIFPLSHSCDNREDFFYKKNEKPSVQFIKDGDKVNTLNDSVKKGYSKNYFNYYVDDKNQDRLFINYIKGSGQVDILEQTDKIKIMPDVTGYNEIELYCEDIYGKKDKAKLNIMVFDNLDPVVKFNVNEIDPRKIKIDCSQSYDKDKKFGGKIVQYHYRFSEEDVKTSVDNVIRKLSSGGSYTIECRVQDNDGKWSQWKQESISID